MLIPLALTQFIASFAGSNMNVAISSISKDLDTTIHGVQTAITLFLLCMAALMIPGSKLTDRWGRKRCLIRGLSVYGIGAVIAALAPGLGVLIVGYSGFAGGWLRADDPSDLHPRDAGLRGRSVARPGVWRDQRDGRDRGCRGPLIGGLITTTVSWRASFLLQAVVVATIIYLSVKITDPLPADPTRPFDGVGAALSAAGMSFLVIGILQAGNNNALLVIFLVLGAAFLLWFFLHIRSSERAGTEPLLSTSLFRNRTSNLGLVTQNIQWLLLMGITFVVSVFLQTERGFSAIKTGVIFTAATAGILVSSLAAERLAKRHAQATLIRAGFVVTIVGVALLLAFVSSSSHIWAFVPGLLVIGLGLGVMLTPSVNIVQSAFPEDKQGEISGLSRSVSNLGSSLGTAIAGTILVSELATGNKSYVLAMLSLAVLALIGLAASIFLPSTTEPVPNAPAEVAGPDALGTASERT